MLETWCLIPLAHLPIQATVLRVWQPPLPILLRQAAFLPVPYPSLPAHLAPFAVVDKSAVIALAWLVVHAPCVIANDIATVIALPNAQSVHATPHADYSNDVHSVVALARLCVMPEYAHLTAVAVHELLAVVAQKPDNEPLLGRQRPKHVAIANNPPNFAVATTVATTADNALPLPLAFPTFPLGATTHFANHPNAANAHAYPSNDFPFPCAVPYI